METINHEFYVSLEVAKLLKEAGFDWEVYDGYIMYEDGSGFTTDFQTPYNFNSDGGDLFRRNYRGYKEVISKPFIDVAQRWLREVKGYIILVNYNEYLETFYYSMCYTKNTNRYIDDRDDCRDTSFEEAQEAGIKKALEMILEKGE